MSIERFVMLIHHARIFSVGLFGLILLCNFASAQQTTNEAGNGRTALETPPNAYGLEAIVNRINSSCPDDCFTIHSADQVSAIVSLWKLSIDITAPHLLNVTSKVGKAPPSDLRNVAIYAESNWVVDLTKIDPASSFVLHPLPVSFIDISCSTTCVSETGWLSRNSYATATETNERETIAPSTGTGEIFPIDEQNPERSFQRNIDLVHLIGFAIGKDGLEIATEVCTQHNLSWNNIDGYLGRWCEESTDVQ